MQSSPGFFNWLFVRDTLGLSLIDQRLERIEQQMITVEQLVQAVATNSEAVLTLITSHTTTMRETIAELQRQLGSSQDLSPVLTQIEKMRTDIEAVVNAGNPTVPTPVTPSPEPPSPGIPTPSLPSPPSPDEPVPDVPIDIVTPSPDLGLPPEVIVVNPSPDLGI
ncbi:hypothetical protein HC928_04145 [bacterium]|nr:hypothetical protein [bacterium]